MSEPKLKDGPDLQVLLRRLLETPVEFLDEPHNNNRGVIYVDAVVSDLCRQICGQEPELSELRPFAGLGAAKERNFLRIVLISSWILADPYFLNQISGVKLFSVLRQIAQDLAPLVAAERFVQDPDRREELARLVLKELGLKPAGESEAQAQDRLSTISSSERKKTLRASRQAEERARLVREALARKAAKESADKWSRE